MTFQARYSGSFTSDDPAARHDVELPQGQPDRFVVRNRTAWGDDAAETSVQAEWLRGMAFDSFQSYDQAVTSGALSTEAGTTNGFRFIDEMNPPQFAALATTAISAAEPAVATMADTGSIAVGDIVRITGSTGMLQIAGYDFQVDGVSANTNITLQLDAQNFAAAATAGNVRLIIPNRMYPRYRYIVPLEDAAGITQEAQAVVTFSVDHDFSVGEKVSFRVDDEFGMSEINNMVGTVLSIGNMAEGAVYTAVAAGEAANAIRVDIDTSAFTAFAFPTSANAADGFQPAMVVPAGAGPQNGANPPLVPTSAAFDNRSRYLMRIGTSVITSAGATYDWWAEYSNQHEAE